jgi:hypothetical protein
MTDQEDILVEDMEQVEEEVTNQTSTYPRSVSRKSFDKYRIGKVPYSEMFTDKHTPLVYTVHYPAECLAGLRRICPLCLSVPMVGGWAGGGGRAWSRPSVASLPIHA